MSQTKVKSGLLNFPDQTDFVKLPSGTTAQRPVSPEEGYTRYNTTDNELEFWDGVNWKRTSETPAPTILSVEPVSFNGDSGSSFTLTGTNFQPGDVVKFITGDSTKYTAAETTFVDEFTLTATTPVNFLVSQEPISLEVLNTGGKTATIEDAIDCGGTPSWDTVAGSVFSGTSGDYIDIQVSASDPDVENVSYSITAGSLPSGISLNSSTGQISGTLPVVSGSTTNTFSITPSDGVNTGTARQFSIINAPVPSIAIYGDAFYNFSVISSNTTLTIANPQVSQTGGATSWSSYASSVSSDSNLSGFIGSLSINDTDDKGKLILNKSTDVYMLRNSGWNLVSTSGWASYNSTNYILAADQPENFVKTFAAGSYYLDNNSAMYIAKNTVSPVRIGVQNLTRHFGNAYFSPGFYGVDIEKIFTHGFHVSAMEWVTGSSNAGHRTWFFVMEKDSAISSRYYVRAGWMFLDNNAGAGYKRTMSVSEASSTVGSLQSGNVYRVPAENHLASGEYYLGWYSGDPNGGTQPNGSINSEFSASSYPNGSGYIYNTSDDSIPSNNLQVDFQILEGRNMAICSYGW